MVDMPDLAPSPSLLTFSKTTAQMRYFNGGRNGALNAIEVFMKRRDGYGANMPISARVVFVVGLGAFYNTPLQTTRPRTEKVNHMIPTIADDRNYYLHYREELQTVRPWWREMVESSKWDETPTLVVREPLPQHYAAAVSKGKAKRGTGVFQGWDVFLQSKRQCVESDTSLGLDFRQRAFADVSKDWPREGLRILRVHELTEPLFFAHGKGELDCTHFCWPVVYAWNARLAEVVKGEAH